MNTGKVVGTGDQSTGTTTRYEVELEPYTYGAVHFVADPETGLPHVMLDMVQGFEVDRCPAHRRDPRRGAA